MLTRDNLQRGNHVELSSQQRRVRHVTSISARNITPREGFSNLNLLGIYYTLHLNDEAFYTSEIKNSFNPTWQSFDTSQISEDLNTSSTSFIVRIWGGEKENFSLLIEWNVDLCGLSYLGDKIIQDGDSYEPNSIIFGFRDGYYVAPKQTEDKKENETNLKSSLLKVNQELVRSSYNLSSLHRLHTLVRAIRQTQLQIRQIKASVQRNLHITRHNLLKVSECDRLKLSVNMLREELQKHKETLTIEQKNERELTELVKVKGEELQKRQDGFDGVKKNFGLARKTHIANREALVKTNVQLLMRRKQLCHELTYIYPIEVLENKENVVCGLSLPNTQSQEFSAADEETISSALGYVCHLVSMIGNFFQVPLRYPATVKGSRTTMSDFVNDRLPDKEREFPLFIKGKEKCQFEFGVFLLNKNIAQIRFCLGLSTTDLRLTLPNMKSLFDTKFGGSSPYRSLPIDVIARVTSPTTHQATTSEKHENEKPLVPSDDRETLAAEELCLGLEEVHSHEDYIVSHTNGPATESVLPIKPQTAKHRFLASGQTKSPLNTVSGVKKEKIKADEVSRRMMTGNGEMNVEGIVKDSEGLGRDELMKSSIGYLNCAKIENNIGTCERTNLLPPNTVDGKPPDLGMFQDSASNFR